MRKNITATMVAGIIGLASITEVGCASYNKTTTSESILGNPMPATRGNLYADMVTLCRYVTFRNPSKTHEESKTFISEVTCFHGTSHVELITLYLDSNYRPHHFTRELYHGSEKTVEGNLWFYEPRTIKGSCLGRDLSIPPGAIQRDIEDVICDPR